MWSAGIPARMEARRATCLSGLRTLCGQRCPRSVEVLQNIWNSSYSCA